jgi:hypothetical protein
VFLTLKNLDEASEARSTPAAQFDDPSMKEVFAGEPIAQGTVDCNCQPGGALCSREVDDRSRRGDRRDAVDLGEVEPAQVTGSVQHMPEPGD